MSHDVFISYAPEDEKAAEDVCNFLESNGRTCWIKKRNFGKNSHVKEITEAIESSQCFVLVYSKNSNKSNFVSTDTDIAFSSVPIIVFAVDDSSFENELHFYLKDKPKIDAYPNPEKFHDELLADISKFITDAPQSDSQNDVYISYSDDDLITAEAICHVLEENRIRCWLKKRDLSVDEGKSKIIDTIEKSKALVLVYSKNAMNSNFVNADLEFALQSNVPVLSYKIEECENLENLNDAHWLDAYPDPEEKFGQLVSDVGNLIDRPIDNPKISHVNLKKEIEDNKQKELEQSENEPSQGFFERFKKNKHYKLILIAIAIIAIICISGVYLLYNPSLFLDDDHQLVKKGDGSVGVEEIQPVDKLYLVPSGVYLNTENCVLKFKLYDKPENFDQYTINAKFYDESGNKIDETTTSMRDVTYDEEGKLVLVNHTCDKVVTTAEVTVFDENGDQVFHTKIPSW